MSAEILRTAAALMRSRAERTTAGPWSASSQYGRVDVFRHPYIPGAEMVAEMVDAYDATHIASWHPVVALAVADWLGDLAADECFDEMTTDNCCACHRGALEVARAYLNTP